MCVCFKIQIFFSVDSMMIINYKKYLIHIGRIQKPTETWSNNPSLTSI